MHMQTAATIYARTKARQIIIVVQKLCMAAVSMVEWLLLAWWSRAVHACYFSTIKNKKITFNIRDIGAMVQLFATC